VGDTGGSDLSADYGSLGFSVIGHPSVPFSRYAASLSAAAVMPGWTFQLYQ
jgi:hypothetical protein